MSETPSASSASSSSSASSPERSPEPSPPGATPSDASAPVPAPPAAPVLGSLPVAPPLPQSQGGGGPENPFRPSGTAGQGEAPVSWVAGLRPAPPALIPGTALWAALATGLLAAVLLSEGGLGVNLLIVAVPAAVGAFFAARAAGRRLRPWTFVWAVGGLGLLAVPALRDAGWPTFLAVVSALALGSLALHGGRNWPGVLLGSVGLVDSLGSGAVWGWRGLRDRTKEPRGGWGRFVRPALVAVGLLVVFGALFAGADAAFADLLGSLAPDVSMDDSPWRALLFLAGLVGALAAARTAAAPVRWDRIKTREGRARGRMEWALPLVVLDALFAVFIAVQLAVLFGGYDKVLEKTGLTYAEYARQGFWQLLCATLLTLLVIALALRWAPRSDPRDRTLVRVVLGVLCVLTLVVVVSALRRMELYVDAYGLTRLRVSVAAMEIWLGVVLLLIIGAGILGARRLPQVIAASAAAAVLAFGLLSPDALVAEQNVQRYERAAAKGEGAEKIDLSYLRGLSADAVPALDRLPEPLRSCALSGIKGRLGDDDPWYAMSRGEARAREIFEERGVDPYTYGCETGGERGGFEGEYEEEGEYEVPEGEFGR
ncbi:DUF4153 domain-containing protein [Streptomyces sp. NPDC050504]|uniref:DUF4153 domain-containing protein n=1 Tax=Streptomyces sp. NPDC050504 TaxID=3365618 RepID=UPI0037AC7378